MLDTVDKLIEYPFIGNEFLTWMWYKGETVQDFNFAVGNKIVFSKSSDGKICESVTIKGEGDDLIVGKVAMSDGFIVSEMQLVYSKDDPRYYFSMKGTDLSFNGLKMPKIVGDDNDEDDEGLILASMLMIDEVTSIIDKAFSEFIIERMSDEWVVTVEDIKKWINEG